MFTAALLIMAEKRKLPRCLFEWSDSCGYTMEYYAAKKRTKQCMR